MSNPVGILTYPCACVLTLGSSDAPTPEKQAEQIMAIYPIIPGQKYSDWNMIPPSGHPHNAETPSPGETTTDLIDFGQNESPTATVTPPQSNRNSKDIPSMLQATGRQPDGPLIDFAGDVKNNSPNSKGQSP